jgi:hypothetical protein
MAARDYPLVVGNGEMQVGSIGSQGARQAEEFKVAIKGGDAVLAGQADASHRQAADPADQPAGPLLPLVHPGLQGQPQVVARPKSQRHQIHQFSAPGKR